MIKYIKDVISHIPLIISVIFIFYGITAFAVGGEYDSEDVKYDNTNSGLTSTTVQDAVDELYAISSDYSIYSSRLTTITNKIGNTTLTTSNKKLIGAINEIYDRFDSNGVLLLTKGGSATSGSSPKTAAAIRTALGVPTISDLPSYSTTNFTWHGLTFTLHKYGRTVTVVIGGTYSASGSAGSTPVASSYRPVGASACGAILTNATGDLYTSVTRIKMETDGGITLSNASDSKTYYGYVSYVSAS